MKLKYLIQIMLVLLCLNGLNAVTMNGFDLSNSSIPVSEILSGGPGKDGIPAIDNPQFISLEDVDFLKENDVVIAIKQGSEIRAYPTRILIWHEIVNDVVAGIPLVITYCPLCGTGMVFERKIGDTVYDFGVSGLLYQSDVLMYDRQTESLWSQLAMKSVSGINQGKPLKWRSSDHLTFSALKKKYPNAKVLSTETGSIRNYQANAYSDYFDSSENLFPVPELRSDFPTKSWVIGVLLDGKAKAYAVDELKEFDEIEDKFGGEKLKVLYDEEKKFHEITRENGEVIPSVLVFWFAWQAFYPATEIWEVKD